MLRGVSKTISVVDIILLELFFELIQFVFQRDNLSQSCLKELGFIAFNGHHGACKSPNRHSQIDIVVPFLIMI